MLSTETAFSPLYAYLCRHPWSRFALIQKMFGEGEVIHEIQQNPARYRGVDVSDLGECYAISTEPDRSLIHARRWNTAREYVLQMSQSFPHQKQVALFFNSLTPGIEADGEFVVQEAKRRYFFRLWVDPGGCDPAALNFVRKGPIHFGSKDSQIDLILTANNHRAQAIALQLQVNWRIQKRVYVHVLDLSKTYQVQLRGKRTYLDVFPGKVQTEALIKDRLKTGASGLEHRQNELGLLSTKLNPTDWAILHKAGSIPVLTEVELAFVMKNAMDQSSIQQIQKLKTAGLIEYAADFPEKNRLRLSPTGVELLIRNWNIDLESFRRFQPWPKNIDMIGKISYSTRAVEHNFEHNRLVREFCLSLLYSARVYSAKALRQNGQRMTVNIESTIGSRIVFPECRRKKRKTFTNLKFFSPDALFSLHLYKAIQTEGNEGGQAEIIHWTREVFLELDRSTIANGDLPPRFDQYLAYFETVHSKEKPLLLWVIEGDDKREEFVLKLLEERHLPGCTIRINRLLLVRPNLYWNGEECSGLIPQPGNNTWARFATLWPVYRYPGMKEHRNIFGTIRPLISAEAFGKTF